jgi:hypothetical protein
MQEFFKNNFISWQYNNTKEKIDALIYTHIYFSFYKAELSSHQDKDAKVGSSDVL